MFNYNHLHAISHALTSPSIMLGNWFRNRPKLLKPQYLRPSHSSNFPSSHSTYHIWQLPTPSIHPGHHPLLALTRAAPPRCATPCGTSCSTGCSLVDTAPLWRWWRWPWGPAPWWHWKSWEELGVGVRWLVSLVGENIRVCTDFWEPVRRYLNVNLVFKTIGVAQRSSVQYQKSIVSPEMMMMMMWWSVHWWHPRHSTKCAAKTTFHHYHFISNIPAFARLQINTQYEILSKPKIQLNQPPPNHPIPISVELPPESGESVHSKCP